MIKSLSVSLVVLSAGILLYSLVDLTPDINSKPCDNIITYRLGNIDSRFPVNEQQLIDVMKEVEELWGGALNRRVLTHSRDGNIAIHLIYGEQQKFFEEERARTNIIEGKEQQLNSQEREYLRHSQNYQEILQQYKRMLEDYNNMVDQHNRYVSELRGKKVTAEDQKKIKENEERISRFKVRLDQKHQEVESMRQRANKEAEQLNRLNSERSELIKEYNSRFTEPRKFDQGRYVREGKNERIYIYQFSDLQSLKAVLAHEFGHALGIGHVENPASIMYELMSEQNVSDLRLSREDINALKAQCSE